MFGAGGSGFGGFGQQNQQNQAQQQQPGQTGGLFGAQQQQQPASGTGFGGFGAQPSTTFGGGNTGGSLFGQASQQPQQPAQGGFTFGQSTNNATATPFGQQNNQAKPATFGGFGASTNTTTPAAGGATGFGGFGSSTTASPFGAAGGNTFGAKPATSLFGQPQQQASNTFGQPAQGGGLFGGAGGLGSAAQIAPMPTQGTSNPPYDLKPQPEGPPDTPYDHDKKTPQLLNYTSITCMKPYRAASLEELRLQDYEQGRKTGNGGMATGGGFGQSTSTGGFGAPSQPGSLFGQQQPQQQNTFGTGGLFGQSTQQGQQPGQSTGGLFGNAGNTGGSLFGQQQQSQPQSGGLFGQAQNTQQPSGGFGFGASTQQSNTAGGGFSFGQNNTQQQNKPAGGLFGGFNQTAAPASSGFSFGGTNNQTQQPATGGFGASSTGFGFGSTAANANQPKPGGLFGAPAASTAPTFGGFGATSGAASSTDNKPAFSFGGGGFGSSAAPGQQTATAAPSGGLFGAAQPTTTSQPTTGFSFGAPSSTGATAGSGGSLFGGQQNQPSTGGFGAGGGLFGNKPATTGGLFGQPQAQQQQQQPATGGFGFGAGNTNTGTTGGLFGNTQQNKPAGGGLFGSLGGNNNQQQSSTGGGLFGNTQNNTNTLGSTGGGLFGGGQTTGNTGGSSLFGGGNNNNQTGGTSGMGGGLFGSSTTGGTGFNLGGQSNAGGGFGGSLFGNSQMQNNNQQAPNVSVSLNSNPYGTDALFGGQAGALNGSNLAGSNNSTNNGLQSQPHLPFNVSLSRSTAKKQPPIVPPFRPSSRNSIRITKLRGSTPGFRESTPGREGTPGPSASLFSSSPAPSSYQRLSSPSPSIFRGLSDDLPRSQRESSVPAAAAPLPPQAFVSRPSVKRLVLDDNASRSSTTGLGRSNSLFGSRANSTTPAPAYNRNGTPAGSHTHFSPALETAFGSTQSIRPNEGDSSLTSSMFQTRKGLEETPSKGAGGADISLPALNRSASSKPSKEDALLPLDYWTLPALSELREWSHAELQEVEGFVVGRKGYGQVAFDAPVDLTSVGELGIIPGGLVILRTKECMVYPDEEECFDENTGKERDGVQPGFEPRKITGGKASRGSGLNVPAIVKLEKCWPYDRSTRLPIKDEEHIRVKQLVNKLKRRTDAHYIGFDAGTGTWSFKVDHFSRYGLDETDEDATDDEGMTEGGGKGSVKDKSGAQTDSSAKKGDMRRLDDDDEDEDDDVPPPARALGEDSDEGDDEDEEIGASQHTPRASTQFRSTPVPASQSRASAAPSTVSSQPWAASLGLEPRRVQVMQASFFGSNDRVSSHEPLSGASSRTVKQSRLASPSFGSSQAGAVASRASFLGPLAEDAGASKVKSASTAINAPFDAALSTVPSTRPRKFSRLELPSSSIADGGQGIAIDAGLSMGRSFRVGWGPNGMYAHSGSMPATGEATDTVSTVILTKIRVFPSEQEKKELERMEKLLQTQLEHSMVESGDEEGPDGQQDCPAIFPLPTIRFKDFITPLEGLPDCLYETAIFKLGAALFDEVETKLSSSLDHQRELKDEVLTIRRRNNVANWIRWYTGETIRNEVRSQAASTGKNAGEQSIFSHLSGGFFEEACKQSIDVGDVRLATLIAQASSGGDEEEYRMDIADQLSVWRSSGVDAFVSTEYRRIMELLSGNVLWSRGNGKREEGEAVRDIKIAAGLDWVRTFALFLHFDCRFDSGLSDVLRRYESNIGGEAEIVPPLPPHLDKEIRPGSQRFRDAVRTGDYHRDLLFHLLKVFCDPEYLLEDVLQPLASGASKLSFSLAFHTSLLLSKVLFKRDFSDRVDLGIEDVEMAQEINIQGNSGKSDQLCVDFAMQLETMGMWRWSAFILLHLELKESRRENVQALLARHADDFELPSERNSGAGSADSIVGFLVDDLRIPIEWLYVAKADQASSQQDKWLEYQYSLCSLDRSRAHDIAVRFLAPEGIIRHDFEFMLQLFAPFQAAGLGHAETDAGGDNQQQQLNAAQDVAGWARGGQVYVDYIAICRSLPYLLSNSSSKMPSGTASSSSFLATSNRLLDKDGQSSIEKCKRLAERIPKLMADIRQLFDSLPSNVTAVVAQTQMITSLYTCVRMLKNSPLFRQHFDLSDLAEVAQGAGVSLTGGAEESNEEQFAKEVAVEVENLQFFANDYCSMLVGAA